MCGNAQEVQLSAGGDVEWCDVVVLCYIHICSLPRGKISDSFRAVKSFDLPTGKDFTPNACRLHYESYRVNTLDTDTPPG